MEHNRKQKLLMIIALVAGIASLSIGFAAFSTTLNISSSASVTPNSDTFSVAFSLQETETRTGQMDVYSKSPNVTTEIVSVSNEPTPLISNINVGFSQPGQYVLYRLYIRNEGEYTAYLNNVNFIGNKICTSESDATESLVQSACDDIKITVQIAETVYDDTTTINNHILEAGTSEDFFVKLEYAADGAYSDGPFSVSFPNISIVYSTIDDSSIAPTLPTKVARLVSGDLNTPGSIVAIGNEQFYIINQEDGKVNLLSKYNLYVGNSVSTDDEFNAIIKPLENPTGIQDERAIGLACDLDGNPLSSTWVGTVPFSLEGTNYNGSIVENYVNDYAAYLAGLGVKIEEARLITIEELDSLGCDSEGLNCRNAADFVKQTTYWTGSIHSDGYLWVVFADVGSPLVFTDSYDIDCERGVRPVIEISLSEIDAPPIEN